MGRAAGNVGKPAAPIAQLKIVAGDLGESFGLIARMNKHNAAM